MKKKIVLVLLALVFLLTPALSIGTDAKAAPSLSWSYASGWAEETLQLEVKYGLYPDTLSGAASAISSALRYRNKMDKPLSQKF